MKDNHPIDKLFREGLSSQKMTPPEGAWASIESNIQGKKGRKGIIFYLAIAASFSLLCAFTWTTYQGQSTDQVELEIAKLELKRPNFELEQAKKAASGLLLPTTQPTDIYATNEMIEPNATLEKEIRKTRSEQLNIKGIDKVLIERPLFVYQVSTPESLSLDIDQLFSTRAYIEQPEGSLRRSFVNGILAVAKGVNGGKKTISEIRQSKNQFIIEELKYGQSQKVADAEATIDEDSPSNQK
jgi:hypothetical protein